MRVLIIFTESGEAPARASSVASVLEGAGHVVTRSPVSGSSAALLAAIQGSPDVIHACGSDVWRSAGLAARVARAAIVYDDTNAVNTEPLPRGRSGRAVRRGRGQSAVLAGDDRDADKLRWAFGLPYLPPVVGAVGPGGGEEGSAVLSALYDRLPRLNPPLPSSGARASGKGGGRLIRVLLEPIRRGALRHPFALVAYLRGRRLRMRGRSAEAASALVRARAGDPGNDTYGLYLAKALREAGSVDDAAEVLRGLASTAGERNVMVLGEIGVEFARLSLTTEAKGTVLELRSLGERSEVASAVPLVQAAQVSVALGDLAEGRELAARSAELAPDRSLAQRLAAQVFERAGEPSAALELARRLRDRHQQRRLSGLLRSLEPAWAPSLAGTRTLDRAGDGGVLSLLEVSLPHAPSGYAYRSRDLLAALRSAGFDPIAATRLGFPASRGIADFAPVESVDGEIHHRFVLPGLRRYTGIPVDRQIEVNAESVLALAERTRPSLILAGNPHLNGAVALALRSALGRPVVYDVRGFPEMSWATQAGGSESELYRLRRDAETGCAAAADAVITLSETMKAELVSRGLDPDRVSVVPHVVDTDRYSPRPADERLARSYGIDGKFAVGCVTSLNDYEGMDVLLRAVARARVTRPDLTVLIVGDGPAKPSLQALAGELGIEGDVVFTGRIDQDRIPDHYALLELFVLPRHDLEVCRTVTPLKPFEALAMGVPVIASDLPALAELISASEGGQTIRPGSDEALAAGIIELAGDDSAREELASRGREYAVTAHNPARAGEALALTLGRLMDRG